MFWLSNRAAVVHGQSPCDQESDHRSLKRDLGEIDVCSDSRSLLNILVPWHRAVAEIKVKHSSVKISARWIRTHVDHPGNKWADELVKAATEHLQVDVAVKLTTNQA